MPETTVLEDRKAFMAEHEQLAIKLVRARTKAAKARVKAEALERQVAAKKLEVELHCGQQCFKVIKQDDYRVWFYVDDEETYLS